MLNVLYVNIEHSKSNYEYSKSFMEFLEDLSLVLYSSSYTPHPSVLSSNSAANHNLYADDTQLLLSFSALDFSRNITHSRDGIELNELLILHFEFYTV